MLQVQQPPVDHADVVGDPLAAVHAVAAAVQRQQVAGILPDGEAVVQPFHRRQRERVFNVQFRRVFRRVPGHEEHRGVPRRKGIVEHQMVPAAPHPRQQRKFAGHGVDHLHLPPGARQRDRDVAGLVVLQIRDEVEPAGASVQLPEVAVGADQPPRRNAVFGDHHPAGQLFGGDFGGGGF